MSQYELPPIVRLAERLVVMVEEAVRRFARYHRYTFGAELRRQAHAGLQVLGRTPSPSRCSAPAFTPSCGTGGLPAGLGGNGGALIKDQVAESVFGLLSTSPRPLLPCPGLPALEFHHV